MASLCDINQVITCMRYREKYNLKKTSSHLQRCQSKDKTGKPFINLLNSAQVITLRNAFFYIIILSIGILLYSVPVELCCSKPSGMDIDLSYQSDCQPDDGYDAADHAIIKSLTSSELVLMPITRSSRVSHM